MSTRYDATADAPARRLTLKLVAANLAGAAMLAGSVFVGVSAAQTAQARDDARATAQAHLEQVRSDADKAEDALAHLPGPMELDRWLSASRAVAGQVADKQNLLLQATAPEQTEILWPEEFTVPPNSRGIGLTDEQRDQQVRDYRSQRSDQAQREMIMLLDPAARDREGFDASGPWHHSVKLDPNLGSDLSSFTWVPAKATSVTEKNTLSLDWTLVDSSGKARALVRAGYDPAKKVIVDPQIISFADQGGVQ